MSARGIASLVAGFGTGYLNAEQKKKEEERQAKLDKILFDKAEREKKEAEKQDAVDKGLEEVGAMKVGELRDEKGAVDTSQQGFASRLAAQGVSPEIVPAASAAYAKAAQQPGAESWLKNSFQDPATGAGGVGNARATTEEDINNARAEAFSKGGAKFDANRMAALKDAATAKYKDGLSKLMAWDPASGDFSVVKKVYDQYDDGHDLNGETGDNGKFYTYYTDKEGNKLGKQEWSSPAEFKQMAISHLVDPNNMLGTITNMMRFEDKRFEKTMALNKEARDAKKDEVDLEGKVILNGINTKRLQNADTEISLDNQAKRLNITKTNEEILDKRNERKNEGITPEKFRENVNAARSAFDNSFKRDQMGNIMGSELDSKLYADAVDVIGLEIKNGTTISRAQKIARDVYDEAKQKKVSVSSVYEAMKTGKQVPAPTNRPPLSSFQK